MDLQERVRSAARVIHLRGFTPSTRETLIDHIHELPGGIHLEVGDMQRMYVTFRITKKLDGSFRLTQQIIANLSINFHVSDLNNRLARETVEQIFCDL